MQDLGSRTKQFALRIIRVFQNLPQKTEAFIIGKQLLRCGTSVGAHYSEAVRARSNVEFIAKIEGGLQELSEIVYWIELLGEAGIMEATRLSALLAESQELTAILVTVAKNAKKRKI